MPALRGIKIGGGSGGMTLSAPDGWTYNPTYPPSSTTWYVAPDGADVLFCFRWAKLTISYTGGEGNRTWTVTGAENMSVSEPVYEADADGSGRPLVLNLYLNSSYVIPSSNSWNAKVYLKAVSGDARTVRVNTFAVGDPTMTYVVADFEEYTGGSWIAAGLVSGATYELWIMAWRYT